MRASTTSAGSLPKLGVAMLLLWGTVAASARGDEAAIRKNDEARGKELFLREWLPDDPRARAGDGLGPVYNDSSCVACHNMGAPGGAGPSSKDVSILSALPSNQGSPLGSGVLGAIGRAFLGRKSAAPKAKEGATPPAATDADRLARIHAGFRSTRSVVFHRYGSDPGYQEWRKGMLASLGSVQLPKSGSISKRDAAQLEILQVRGESLTTFAALSMPNASDVDGFQLILSRRNTPPLFGAGRIDAVPDAVIEAGAAKADPDFPEARGRVSRLEGGKIGRFGWKGQTPSLQDFVLTACAVELGLEVPGHSQGSLPNAPAYRAPGLDLDESECASLVAFVRSLPAPSMREPANRREAAALRTGEEAFRTAGCAACHVPKLGEIPNLYSDLLLHDMGDALSDSGFYGVFVNDSQVADASKGAEGDTRDGADAKPSKGAGRREWRTPPLWGFRDSGPYLHDGRAENLEQAVAFHEGQAARSAQEFFMLPPRQRQKIEAFLKSLTATGDAAGTRE